MNADSCKLALEITESVVIENQAWILDNLRQLKDLGIELHMDDFGTGQSSISCLQELPFDVLKLDASFIQHIGLNRKYTAVIHAVITLTHNLQMKVVAEGVETNEQLAQLLALDCDYAQGYLFARPMSADAAQRVVKQENPFVLCASNWVPLGDSTLDERRMVAPTQNVGVKP